MEFIPHRRPDIRISTPLQQVTAVVATRDFAAAANRHKRDATNPPRSAARGSSIVEALSPADQLRTCAERILDEQKS